MKFIEFIFDDIHLSLSILWWSRLLLPLLALIFVCMLLIIIPQQWHTLQQGTINKKIKPGTRITTIHGIAGTVCRASENFIIIELDDGRKIEIIRHVISSIDHEKK